MAEPKHDVQQPAIMQVEVTNGCDFPINDMFNGVPIVFPMGETVTVSAAVARHCFAWPGDDAERAMHMAKRYGWSGRDYLAQDQNRVPLWRQNADKVKIEPVYYDLVKRDRNAPIAADDGSDLDAGAPPPSDKEPATVVVGRGKKPRSRTPVEMKSNPGRIRRSATQRA